MQSTGSSPKVLGPLLPSCFCTLVSQLGIRPPAYPSTLSPDATSSGKGPLTSSGEAHMLTLIALLFTLFCDRLSILLSPSKPGGQSKYLSVVRAQHWARHIVSTQNIFVEYMSE